MTTITTTAEKLGLVPTVYFGQKIGNHGFSHEELVAAFKANGLRPVSSAAKLLGALIAGFQGYIPDEAFFTEAKPNCPYVDHEFYYGDYLKMYGGWPPNESWLLEKE